MNRKMKLLAVGFVILIVLVGIEGIMVETVANKDTAIRVACVGDSITGGTEYPTDLWWRLGTNYVVGNFGIGGATVDSKSDNSYINQTAFVVAKQFQPDIIVIMLGTNDANTGCNESNAAFIADYIKLISEFQALASKPKVWIALPPPIFNNTANLSEENFLQNVIPSIKQVAAQMNLPIIDVNTPLLAHSEYFYDGVHPDVSGAWSIARIVYRALTS